ncbi:MAG: hypothetical protein FWE04_01640 [Oscillospiraceae bacterium]|nr:hypothetical protein [Oscillospiraceae bacterium]
MNIEKNKADWLECFETKNAEVAYKIIENCLMPNYNELYGEWFTNRSRDDIELLGKVFEYEDIYFTDMTFKDEEFQRALLICQDENRNDVNYSDELFDSLSVSYGDWRFYVADLDGIGGSVNYFKREMRVNTESKDDISLILHEMIHIYELTLQNRYPIFAEYLIIQLYNKLKPLIENLDEKITLNSHPLLSGDMFRAGNNHGTLFLLKSLDLDLRLKLSLGTVFGYDREGYMKDEA